jgi:hypothetical protein
MASKVRLYAFKPNTFTAAFYTWDKLCFKLVYLSNVLPWNPFALMVGVLSNGRRSISGQKVQPRFHSEPDS